MSFNTAWPRVYPDLSKSSPNDVRRLTIELPASDALRIQSVAITPAIFSLICQTSLKAAADYVLANNLTYRDSEAFVNLIRQRAFSGIVEASTASDDAGRGKGVHDGVEDAAKESAGAGEKAKGRGRRKE